MMRSSECFTTRSRRSATSSRTTCRRSLRSSVAFARLRPRTWSAGQFRGYPAEKGVPWNGSKPLRLSNSGSSRGTGRRALLRSGGQALAGHRSRGGGHVSASPQVLFHEALSAKHIRFRLGPQIVIAIGARAKASGEAIGRRRRRALPLPSESGGDAALRAVDGRRHDVGPRGQRRGRLSHRRSQSRCHDACLSLGSLERGVREADRIISHHGGWRCAESGQERLTR